MNGMYDAPPSNLNQCPSCGRSFNDVAYQKHVKICDKVFNQKRKVFNAQAHRVAEPEQKQMMKRGRIAERKSQNNQSQAIGGMPKWKLQSMQFRMMLGKGRAEAGPSTQQ